MFRYFIHRINFYLDNLDMPLTSLTYAQLKKRLYYGLIVSKQLFFFFFERYMSVVCTASIVITFCILTCVDNNLGFLKYLFYNFLMWEQLPLAKITIFFPKYAQNIQIKFSSSVASKGSNKTYMSASHTFIAKILRLRSNWQKMNLDRHR